jgi:putative SOS response-associated peptidase YedK
VATKPAFRSSFARRRCIVPVDGFYEWKVVPGSKVKQPFYIHRPDDEPFAFGGLWSEWHGTDASGHTVTLRSVTIITGQPNEKMAEIHDRMPIILPPSAWSEWLDEDQTDTEAVGRLLVPAPPELIEFHPVSTAVNSVRNHGPELIEPAAPIEPTLFP